MNSTHNSYFNTILERRNIDFHDGRPLWKYNLSDEEYDGLKFHLTSVRQNYFDPRDLTLFFAEWWKNGYDGGSPSREMIYKQLDNCNLTLEEFYKYARRGATVLGIRWIKSTRSFYFRTLLMQGGLPINHVLKHSNVYTTFLKKVLEINPSTIEDFSYDEEITSILPFASRHEAVYDSCLQIVQAIWNGNEEYLKIFENKSSETTSFKKIADELKKHKAQVEKSIKKRSKFRAYWILNREDPKHRLNLDLSFPANLPQEDLTDIVGIGKNELQSEYRLMVDENIVLKLKRTRNDNFKIFTINNSPIYFNGEDTKTDIYLGDNMGNRYDLPILAIDFPNTAEPTLWTQKTEHQWILNKGANCKQENAAILFNEPWMVHVNGEIEKITLNGETLNWLEFSGSMEVTNSDDTISFKTNNTSFDWYVCDQKPSWVQKCNMTIIRNVAKVQVFSKNGDKISNTDIRWKLAGEIIWQKWATRFPLGCIEYRISYEDCIEKDCFFNIGDFNLFFESNDEESSTIEILNESNINVKFKEQENLEFEYRDKEITVSFLDLLNIPGSLKANLSVHGKGKNLIVEMLPPFFGVRLVDSKEVLVKDNSELIFGHVTGYRLLAPLQSSDFIIKIFNKTRDDINISSRLNKSSTSLREFEEQVQRLLRLSDPMDKNASVVMEVHNEKDELLNQYIFKNYNSTISFTSKDDDLEITLNNGVNNCENDLYAIPLDCAPLNIALIHLTKESARYHLKEFFPLSKFIIISEGEKNQVSVLPTFIMIENDFSPSNITDKKDRISKLVDKLQDQYFNEPKWVTLRRYFLICLRTKMPYSIFDILRAACSSSELAAKMFCFLILYNEEPNFMDEICQDIENDLGFCFHWISANSWNKAIAWILVSQENQNENENIRSALLEKIQELINQSDPVNWFEKIAKTITTNEKPSMDDFHFKTEVSILRQRLGEKVIMELPQLCPKIIDDFKEILPVTKENSIVKILMKAPLAVALSITSNDEKIWGIDSESEIIRRNIQYAQWIAPGWYGKALLFSLNKLLPK